MVKAALLYADDVRLASAKLPLLHVQSADMMRSFPALLAELTNGGEDGQAAAKAIVESLSAAPELKAVSADFAGTPPEGVANPISALESLEAMWREELLPLFQSSSPAIHLTQLFNFLPRAVRRNVDEGNPEAERLVQAAQELQAAWRSGALSAELFSADDSFETDDLSRVARGVLARLVTEVATIADGAGPAFPVFDDEVTSWLLSMRPGEITVGPAGLAHGLIAALPTFPMAPMDVVLDVRERLRPATARFRAAMLRASGEARHLSGPADLGTLVGELKVREIDPAIAEINESLADLGAIDTLLRGWPKVAIGSLGLAAAAIARAPELAQYVPVAAGASVALADEISKRRQTTRAAKQHPLFFLYAARGYLGASSND